MIGYIILGQKQRIIVRAPGLTPLEILPYQMLTWLALSLI